MAVTESDLRLALRRWPDFVRLAGPVETPGVVSLGALQVDKTQGRYRFGYTYDTSATSCFLKRTFHFPDLGLAGHAVVFRQFDRFTEVDDPPEFAIGWVTLDQEVDLDGWLATLNAVLHESRRLRILNQSVDS